MASHETEQREVKKNLFDGKRVYFSNSIKGDMGRVVDIGAEVVNFMSENGADVLSENVAFLKPEEGLPIFERRTGVDLAKITDPVERARIIRKVDLDWVDEATHLVAVVNGASYGVGMELQRAIDKPRMGMNVTPILCLVQKNELSGLSSMIRGVDVVAEGVPFEIATYRNSRDAKGKIVKFLLENK